MNELSNTEKKSTLFFNVDRFSLRAGWRIAIFLLIATVCSVAVGFISKGIFFLLPALKIQAFAMLLFYAGITFATWIVLRFIDKRPFDSVGLTFKAPAAKDLLLGSGLGFGMMTVIYLTEYSAGWIVIEYRNLQITEILGIFGNSFFLYVVVGYGEELLFRGYILQSLAEGTNKIIAIVVFSILFGFMHGGNPNVTVFAIVNIILAGIWLSVAYFKTQALWLPIGLHFGWNFTQGFIYSLPVSGTTSLKEQIGTAIVTGPEWLTGGAFGPEGGALATLVVIIGTIILWRAPFITANAQVWNVQNWIAERNIQAESAAQIQE